MDYSIVIPVYNSHQTLPILMGELDQVIAKIDGTAEVIMVDDRSPDNSWKVMRELARASEHLRIIRLANNVGQWMATLAGVSRCRGKYIITMDDDLEFDTQDILSLIEAYHLNDAYIIYGMPVKKKNKNMSYRLFFRMRDRFHRIFFSKIRTESFKIFKREIYFDRDGIMYSNLHFEAYTKFMVAEQYTHHIEVNYRKRHSGGSNHTLWMKWKLLRRFGIEYYRSPFKYLLYFLAFFTLLLFSAPYLHLPNYITVLAKLVMSLSVIFIAGILGNYLSNLYFSIKGLPEYVIIEEY